VRAADKDQVNLGYTVIRSPVSGVVVDRVVDLGRPSPPACRRRR
jgi:HlyD family secretion protein